MTTSLTATAMQAEQVKTKTKNDNKVVKRETFIRFTNDDEMTECFRSFGFELKAAVMQTKYFDAADGEKIDSWSARLLRKHGIEVREETQMSCETSYDCVQDIKNHFKLDCTIDVFSYSFAVITYDLTSRQHKSMVRRILHPIRLKGYKVTYDCQTEVTNNAC